MSTRRIFRTISFAAVLALVSSLALVGGAGADDSDQVTVTATIASLTPLSITICDTTAEFGTDLDANGTAAQNSSDTITPIPGDANAGQGAFYKWEPSCSDGALITVSAGNAWDGQVCATPGTITSSQTLSDLRYAPSNQILSSYNAVNSSSHEFPDCSTPADWLDVYAGSPTTGGPGVDQPYPIYFYLLVERSDSSGDFNATTTWTVTG